MSESDDIEPEKIIQLQDCLGMSQLQQAELEQKLRDNQKALEERDADRLKALKALLADKSPEERLGYFEGLCESGHKFTPDEIREIQQLKRFPSLRGGAMLVLASAYERRGMQDLADQQREEYKKEFGYLGDDDDDLPPAPKPAPVRPSTPPSLSAENDEPQGEGDD